MTAVVNTLTVLKSIHVLGATFWVGGGFMLNVAMTLIGRRGEPASMLTVMRVAHFAGSRLFGPLGLIVLVTGGWMTEKYFDWGDVWIVLGLIGLVTAMTVGVAYLGPRSGRAIEALEAGTPPPPGRNWVPIVARLNLLLLSTIVVLMVIKPT
jgi:hypothetical protein